MSAERSCLLRSLYKKWSASASRTTLRKHLSFERLECRLPFAGDLDPSWDADGIVETGTYKNYFSFDEYVDAELDSAERVVVLANTAFSQPVVVGRFLSDGKP